MNGGHFAVGSGGGRRGDGSGEGGHVDGSDGGGDVGSDRGISKNNALCSYCQSVGRLVGNLFLDAPRISIRGCVSVRWFDGPLVRWSVGPLVRPSHFTFFGFLRFLASLLLPK